MDIKEQPEPDDSRSLIVPDTKLVEAEGELEELLDPFALPPHLQHKGLHGLIFGRISSKIVLPFVVVVIVLGGFSGFVVTNQLTSSLDDRFNNQLSDAGKSVNDGVVKVEGNQQELLRLMANTLGIDAAITNNDSASLQKFLVPLQANSTFSYVDVVDANGKQVLALRPDTSQSQNALDPTISDWPLTKNSLANTSDQYGNKYTDLVSTSYGLFIYTGGPVLDNTTNQVVGAILIGIPLSDLINQLTKEVTAQVTIYKPDGTVFGTSMAPKQGDKPLNLDQATLSQIFVSGGQSAQNVKRPLTVAGTGYTELLGGLVVRDKVAAGLGVAVSTAEIDQAKKSTYIQLGSIFGGVALVIGGIGWVLARFISHPISILVRACQMVARGEFNEPVKIHARDETGVLAHTFNQMIDGLKERDRIRDTFSRYMTSQVTDAILKGDVALGGEMRELTMLMSDIRSFTTLSEGMHPEDLVAFLNRYFGAMIDCVVAHDGVINRFMGDAILVVYGAPVRTPDHPKQAVLTALEMRERLVQFNDELIGEGRPPIRIGIGVNTGEAVTGNIGSEVRMEYTVIGETVSSAERTEDLTKEFKTDILVSETTAARLDGRFILGEPQHAMVAGRPQETIIYPVIGLRSDADSQAEWLKEGPLMLTEPLRPALLGAGTAAASSG